jgi:5-methylcytosine-specific restriction protein A
MPTAPLQLCPRGHRKPSGKPCPLCTKSRDQARGSRSARGYDHRWYAVIRPAQLLREPLCRFCLPRVTVATDVDHIDGNSRNNDPANLRSLCKSCHSRRTAKDQSGWGSK